MGCNSCREAVQGFCSIAWCYGHFCTMKNTTLANRVCAITACMLAHCGCTKSQVNTSTGRHVEIELMRFQSMQHAEGVGWRRANTLRRHLTNRTRNIQVGKSAQAVHYTRDSDYLWRRNLRGTSIGTREDILHSAEGHYTLHRSHRHESNTSSKKCLSCIPPYVRRACTDKAEKLQINCVTT